MDTIKGYYKGTPVILFKVKEYDSLNVQEGCDTMECCGDIWIGFCNPYGAYLIYATDTDKIQRETYSDPDMTLTFINKKGVFPERRILCCIGNACSIEFDKVWKIQIQAGQPEPILEELDRIWTNARRDWFIMEKLKNVVNNSMYGLAVPDTMLKHQNVLPDIKNVIFNPPATIVFWEDGSKTVVKAQEEDFDPEKGLAMAISKKALGNKGNYYETIKKWLK